ncbi:zinc dependent phospholipase C family protein [Exiguobacterium algae]|uniref:zinc dependent phospholipase C family protein n=1 Tax=Exiguobacterium algae TaxID=2751250 RepID=UPI001BE91F4A|nr:zinc dependent phospholipase C family protein [Exiguobacterium algae]
MGSHLMHLVIANEVLSHLEGMNEIDFLLGNLAPDAVDAKAGTHYYAGRHDDLSRRLDIEQYWIDSEGEELSYRLGVYCHLVADEIWLQGFYKGWLKQLILSNPSKQAAYYKDFDAYNAQLANRLGGFDFDRLKRQAVGGMHDLVSKVERDAQETEKGQMTMFLPHQFEGYVDTCVLRCRQMVQRKMEEVRG